MSYEKFKRPILAPSIKIANSGRFYPVVSDWINETTSEGTYTVSLSAVIPTDAVAVQCIVRLQDNAFKSYVKASAKASVSTNSGAELRIDNIATDSNIKYAQGVLPVDSTTEILWQVSDSKASSVQTASIGILGYYK